MKPADLVSTAVVVEDEGEEKDVVRGSPTVLDVENVVTEAFPLIC